MVLPLAVVGTSSTGSLSSRNDMLALRLDGSNGAVVWAHTWDANGCGSEYGTGAGPGSASVPSAVTVATNGDVVLVGYHGGASGASSDVLALRLDGSNGAVVWACTWGGSENDHASTVTMASNGDVLVVGFTSSVESGDQDVFVLRLDGSNGTVVWVHTLSWGGLGGDGAIAVAIASNFKLNGDGDLVVVGYTSSLETGNSDVFALQLDGSNGAVVWARTWGGSENDYASAVALASNGDVLVVGYTTSFMFGAGYEDVLALKLDGSNGAVVWARTWGGSGGDAASAVALASNGDVLVVGYTTSFDAHFFDVFVLRLDGSNGAVVWARTWGGSHYDTVSAVALASNGDVLVVGYTTSFQVEASSTGYSEDVFVLPFAFDSPSTGAGSSLQRITQAVDAITQGTSALNATSVAIIGKVNATSNLNSTVTTVPIVGTVDVSGVLTRTPLRLTAQSALPASALVCGGS